METGDENRDVSDNLLFIVSCMFCEESVGEINRKDVELFQNGWVHEFYCLKALIALEQVNTLEVENKKKKSLGVPPCSRKQVAPK